jgi:hypothetical protein
LDRLHHSHCQLTYRGPAGSGNRYDHAVEHASGRAGWFSVGADADLSHIPIGNCAMANELRRASDLEFGAFQPAHPELGAWLKSASAPTDSLHER